MIVALFFIPDPKGEFSNLGRIELPRTQIGERADVAMKARGFDPAQYKRIVTLSANSILSAYLLEHGSLDETAQLYDTEFTDVVWYVGYVRVLDPEAFSLQLDKQGRLLRWSHTVPREAPCATLDREAALALARETMARDFGVDLARESLVSDFATKQENRRDHSFTFERTGWERGEARLRTSIGLQGDEVVDFQSWIKTPEAWHRERAKSGWRKFLADELNTWLGLAKGVFVGLVFILLLRRHLVPWRLGFALALFSTALALIGNLNGAPWFFSGYATTMPLANFLVRQFGGDAVSLIATYLGSALVASVALCLARWAFGWTPAALVVWPRDRAVRREFWLRTLTLMLVSVALF